MKKILSFVIVLSMAFCLFSCGGTVGDSEINEKNAEQKNYKTLRSVESLKRLYNTKSFEYNSFSIGPGYLLTSVSNMIKANIPLALRPFIVPNSLETYLVALGNGIYEWEQETKSAPDEQAPPYDEAMVEAAADCIFYNHRVSTEHTPFCLDDVKRIIKEETVERKLGKDTMARILAKIKFYHPIILNVAREDADLPRSLIYNGQEEDLCCFKVLFSDGSETQDYYGYSVEKTDTAMEGQGVMIDFRDYSAAELSDGKRLNLYEEDFDVVPDYSAASDGFVISKVIRSDMVNVPAATETVLSETGTVCISYNGEVLLMVR